MQISSSLQEKSTSAVHTAWINESSTTFYTHTSSLNVVQSTEASHNDSTLQTNDNVTAEPDAGLEEDSQEQTLDAAKEQEDVQPSGNDQSQEQQLSDHGDTKEEAKEEANEEIEPKEDVPNGNAAPIIEKLPDPAATEGASLPMVAAAGLVSLVATPRWYSGTLADSTFRVQPRHGGVLPLKSRRLVDWQKTLSL